MKCGLIAEKLGHSFSPQIHKRLADYEYLLMPTAKENVDAFLTKRDFDGINVTIPYKQTAMKYCSHLSADAEKIGAVNTVVNKNGELWGYNTDIYGFELMVRRSGISFEGKKVLILGSGGTRKMVTVAAKELGSSETIVVSRTGSVNYENVYQQTDAEIIVNTTPVGMYPNNLQRCIDVTRFPALSGVVDVVYNPLKTALILDCEANRIPCVSGLYMLVAQAKRSSELFTGSEIDDKVIDEIYDELRASLENVVLVGMPGCGKSTIGKSLAKKLCKTFVDADEEIERTALCDIPSIFKNSGEDGFRKLESEVLRKIGSASGRVIATGGGCVTREENYAPLRQNGRIIYLTRDTGKLPKNGRPLSQKNNLNEMFKARDPLYRHFADDIVSNDASPSAAVRKILEVLK